MGKIRRFKRAVLAEIASRKPLAFMHSHGMGAVIADLVERIARRHEVRDAEIHDMLGEARDPIGFAGARPYRVDGSEAFGDEDGGPRQVSMTAGPMVIPGVPGQKATAIVPVRGIAIYDLDWQPYCFSTLLLAQTMGQLAADPDIGTIILDVDTPGGSVMGTIEAADAVWAARRKKKVVALINPLCASAGYWIASQAGEILAVPSADVGSIGVYQLHVDCSAALADAGIKPTFIYAGEFKVEANPFEPLSDDAKAYRQGEVDSIYSAFIKAVARGRGVSAEEVLNNFGKGRCMLAPAAKKAGLIDEIMPIEGAMARCGVVVMPRGGRRGEGEEGAPEAGKPELEVAAVPPIWEGAESIVFRTDVTRLSDGSEDVLIYATKPWPAKAIVSPRAKDGPMRDEAVGQELTFVVANGNAVYRIIGKTLSEDAVCELVSSEYADPPPPIGAAADDDVEAKKKPEETGEELDPAPEPTEDPEDESDEDESKKDKDKMRDEEEEAATAEPDFAAVAEANARRLRLLELS